MAALRRAISGWDSRSSFNIFSYNNIGACAQYIAVLQYGVGMLLGIYVLNRFFNLNPGFGLMMATGFYGSHGTAAAGSTFANLGWAEATDLAITTATVGIVGGILGGVAVMFIAAYLLKWWRPENPVVRYHSEDTADGGVGVGAAAEM